MAIFPLAPDQTIAQMWSNGARGCCETGKFCVWRNWLKEWQMVRAKTDCKVVTCARWVETG